MPTFDATAGDHLMAELTAISIAAATAILGARGSGGVRIKADGSPVTNADEAADAVIREGLAGLEPRLPAISEEQAERNNMPAQSERYFLVDPLDGTRDFIAGLDEYTVNIGLVSDGRPILGIVTAPALGLIWRGIVGRGAERLRFSAHHTSAPEPIHTRSRPNDEIIVMVSRSHLERSDPGVYRKLAAGTLHRLRLFAEILSAGRGRRRPLPPAWADAGLGRGCRPRLAGRREWKRGSARWRRFNLRHAGTTNPRISRLGRTGAYPSSAQRRILKGTFKG